MSFFDRIGILRTISPSRAVLADMGVRWVRAARAHPDLMADVIRLGGVLAMQPDQYQGGIPLGMPIDPVRLAYEAGRRDLATQLCALMGLTHTELKTLMEEFDENA